MSKCTVLHLAFLLLILEICRTEQIKTNIQNPLFMAQKPFSEAVAIASEFIVERYEKKVSNFNLPYRTPTLEGDIEFRLTKQTGQTSKGDVIANLKEKPIVGRSKTLNHHLTKHIILDQSITKLYWSEEFFIIRTLSQLHIYNSQWIFIKTYPLANKLLALTSFKSNIYLLFEDPSTALRLRQITLNFDKNKEIQYPISLPESYRIYEYQLSQTDTYESLYMINDTHIVIYDIIKARIKTAIESKFDHPITKFKVDESYNLAMAYNDFGDFLFIQSGAKLLTVKNSKYTFATFCSDNYLIVGSEKDYQVMQVQQNSLTEWDDYELGDAKMVVCSFNNNKKFIYAIDGQGYLMIYAHISKSWWSIFGTVVLIFLIAACSK